MKYLFALILALASFASAQADSHDSMATTIPFDFVLGEKTFPAGTYTISRISDDPQLGLRIRSSDGKTNVFFHILTSEPVASEDQARLQFRHEGDTYRLSTIVTGLEVYTVAPSPHHQRMADPDDPVVTTVGP